MRAPTGRTAFMRGDALPQGVGLADELLRDWRDAALAWDALRPRLARATRLRVWNPQLYGLDVHERFVRAYPPREDALLALGLNPGKYGMSQTGLPFTSVTAAREKLPALGFDLAPPGLAPPSLRPFLRSYREERSSQSVYALLQRAFGSAEAGWREAYAVSPCALLFLEPNGSNVTPADARLARRSDVLDLRREVARRAIATLRPRGVLLLGQDVARVLRAEVEARVGAERVLVTDHPVARGPGRRGPQWWARTVHDALVARGWA
jgi:single-strand selective monofunctional uracil DNA glycosylase